MLVQGPQVWFMAKPSPTQTLLEQSGERLKLVRIIRDADAKEWCAALNVVPTRWSGWEHGTYPPDITIITRAADMFGFTLDWVFRGHVTTLPEELAREVRRRRPDLVAGAPPDAVPADDWDLRPRAIPRWRGGKRRVA